MKSESQTPRITVAIRKRPLSKKQHQKGETDIIKVHSDNSVVVCESKLKVDMTKYIEQTTFNFDYAFDEKCSNEQIYKQSIRPLVESAFKGAKITCFAYGQTGSGKTFTMKGDLTKGVPGLYYLGAKDIFSIIQRPQFRHLQVLVTFYEIYCGKLFDLLNNRNQLKIREDNKANINVIGMQEKPIINADQFMELVEYGSNFRVTSQNAANSESSRSHAILQITLKDSKKVFSKISFIDLAGNQRGADHMDQNKQTRIDGAQINKSLLSLKECIRALDQGKTHTPFRGSKLTMVLKDSFVGFCKTIMIGNVSPNLTSSQNTINTLRQVVDYPRYADRVKQLKKPNDGNYSMSKEQTLAHQLMLPRNNKNVIKVAVDMRDTEEDIENKKQQARKIQNQINLKQNWKKLQKPESMDIEGQCLQFRKMKTNDVLYNDIRNYQQNFDRKSMNITKNQPKENSRFSQSYEHQGLQNKLVKQPSTKISNNYQNNNGNFSYRNLNHPIQQNSYNRDIQEPKQQNGFYYNHAKISDPRARNFGIQSYQNNPIQSQNIFNHLQNQRASSKMRQQIARQYDYLICEHSNLLQQENCLIKDQMQSIEACSLLPGDYIKVVESSLDKKLLLLKNFRQKIWLLRDRIQETEKMNERQKYFTDEQLLEGLPGEDLINKLF